MLLHCCYTVAVPLYNTVVILLLHCCYTVVTLLLHCCFTVVTLLLHWCYTVVTGGARWGSGWCCYTAIEVLLHCCWHTRTHIRNSQINSHIHTHAYIPAHTQEAHDEAVDDAVNALKEAMETYKGNNRAWMTERERESREVTKRNGLFECVRSWRRCVCIFVRVRVCARANSRLYTHVRVCVWCKCALFERASTHNANQSNDISAFLLCVIADTDHRKTHTHTHTQTHTHTTTHTLVHIDMQAELRALTTENQFSQLWNH
jgi:hypothetical protein